VYRGVPAGVIGQARIALAIVLIIGLEAIYRVIIQCRTSQSTLVSLCRLISSTSVLFGILSLLATHVWIGSKIACAIVGFVLPVVLSGKDNLRSWIPSEDAPLPRQSATRPALMPQFPVIFIIIKTVCSLLRYLVCKSSHLRRADRNFASRYVIHANRGPRYFPDPSAYGTASEGRHAPLCKRSTVWTAARAWKMVAGRASEPYLP
jgi:hypothetical protein